jgi:hypothetical protein
LPQLAESVRLATPLARFGKVDRTASNQRVGSSSLSGRAIFLNENAVFAIPNAGGEPSPVPIVRVLSEFAVGRAGKAWKWSDSRTAPVGITLLHFDDRTDEFCARFLRAGLPSAIRGEQRSVLLLAQGFVKAKQCRRIQNDCGTEQTSGTYQECH